MTVQTHTTERRREVRLESNDVLRWKRSGHPEDNKAWTIDRSPSGFGFFTRIDTAPQPGEQIHIRRYDVDRWNSFDAAFRVTRAEPATDELMVVGCIMEA